MAGAKRSNHNVTASHVGVVSLSFTTELPAQADFKKVLLERYQEAIARSRMIGHRVSFRAEVDPAAGAQTIMRSRNSLFRRKMRFPLRTRASPTPNWKRCLRRRASAAVSVLPRLSTARTCKVQKPLPNCSARRG